MIRDVLILGLLLGWATAMLPAPERSAKAQSDAIIARGIK